MIKYFTTGIIFFLLLSFVVHPALASSIAKIDISELSAKSQYIVIGEVVEVHQLDAARDEAKVNVKAFLKGSSTVKSFVLPLSVRGVKALDSSLEVGNQAVFFLRDIADGQAKKVHYGSIAVFQTHNFR